MGKASKRVLSAGDVSIFCTQLAMILKAGVPLHQGVAAMVEDTGEGRLKKILVQLDELLQHNMPLGEAMEKVGGFPDYLISMLSIGDVSGRLDSVLFKMADYYEREKAMKEKVRGAVLYPATLFVMMSIIVVLLVTKVLPMFEKIFNQIGGNISDEANAALKLGMIAGTVAMAIILFLLVLLVLTLIVAKTKKGSLLLSKILLKVPVLRGLVTKMAARNFASAMSLMLYSGVDVDKSLELSGAVLNNELLARKLEQVRARVRDGVSFTDAIAQAGMFPGLFSRMVSIGFKTGSTSEVMEKLSLIYEDEIDTSLNNMTSLIEPILVGILALIIGVILIAVMLPLAGIMTSIG